MSPSQRTTPILLVATVLIVTACHQRAAAYRESPGIAAAAAGTTLTAGATGEGSLVHFDDTRTSRIEDLFAGRFPGLDVRRTGTGGITMLLRGVQPLLLIDGLEVEPVALTGLQPRSVLRIEVLRNVNETAIYGSRGVNGVVRVTTRR